jgi:hypothetical protein
MLEGQLQRERLLEDRRLNELLQQRYQVGLGFDADSVLSFSYQDGVDSFELVD